MLNQEQRRAVEMTTGPCLVIAGAGTGKTKTIVEKIAHLLRNGAKPEKILALTFSSEAALQLRERSIELMPEARLCRISTFHSFCADFIRAHAQRCGVAENFSIIEELDAAIMMKRELDLETGRALRYANTISKAKDLGLTQDDYRKYIENQSNLLNEFHRGQWHREYEKALVVLRTRHLGTIKNKKEADKLREFIELYENYNTYKDFLVAWVQYEQLKKGLDYADLNKLVLEYVDMYGAEELAVYDYVIVDEFQDTNKVQFELLQHLAPHRNITVVGDQDQTVYAFRGAYANNIEKFRHVFGISEADVVRLSMNYRSSNMILRTAHRLISNNYDDPEASLLLTNSEGIEGKPVNIIRLEDAKEQARRIVEEIEEHVKRGSAYKDMAVLYRSHSSASLIKRALERRGIPFSVSGGADFFHQPEVKTVVSYIYILNNFSNPLFQADQAWWKLLHTVYGLNSSDSTLIAEYKKRRRVPLQLVLYSELDRTGISGDGRERILRLTSTIDLLRKHTNRRVSDLLLDIYEASGIGRSLQGDALSNLRYLHNLASTFETFHGDDLYSFVIYLEMMDELGSKMTVEKVNGESVNLMTIHAAKGLEFPAVFLLDLVRDKFPLTRGGSEPLIPLELNEQYEPVLSATYKSDKEKEDAIKEFTSKIKLREERRLAYVALTRAKSTLYLTLAKDYGSKELREPSQFLLEMGCQPEWFEGNSEHTASSDLKFIIDADLKARETNDSELERAAETHRKLMNIALDRKDHHAAQYHMAVYQSLLEGRPVGKGPAAKEALKILEGIKQNTPVFTPSIAFSVTSLGTFSECQKKYELKHILSMPSRDDEDDTARGFGNAIHEILDLAVKQKVKTYDELEQILLEMTKDDKSFDTDRARRILEVFWQRHHNEIAKAYETEKSFRFSINGFSFAGKIDRIDYLGNNKLRIIDYKTGYVNSDVAKDDRERQLILYALAVLSLPEMKGMQPSELVLEMLEKEKPLEFILENNIVTPKEGRIKSVAVEDVKKQILETANAVSAAYITGFPPSVSDVPCRFCSYKLYCPKWG